MPDVVVFPPESPPEPEPVNPPRTVVVESRDLFGRAQELVVRHSGHEYRLRITRQNKLILTK